MRTRERLRHLHAAVVTATRVFTAAWPVASPSARVLLVATAPLVGGYAARRAYLASAGDGPRELRDLELARDGLQVVALTRTGDLLEVRLDGPAGTLTVVSVSGVSVQPTSGPVTLAVSAELADTVAGWWGQRTPLRLTARQAGTVHAGLQLTGPDGAQVAAAGDLAPVRDVVDRPKGR